MHMPPVIRRARRRGTTKQLTSNQRNLEQLYDLHASICKVFANPSRLRIVEVLGDGERTVSQLVELLGVSKSSASQHLATMREKSVVEFRREGAHVYYRLTSPKILQACRLMREVLIEMLHTATSR